MDNEAMDSLSMDTLSMDTSKNITEKHLTVEEAAAVLSISSSAVHKRVQRGKLTAIHIEGRVYIPWPQEGVVPNLDSDRQPVERQANLSKDGLVHENERLKDRIAHLEDTIHRLEADIEEWRQRDLRKDVLLQQLTQRLPALPTPEESQQRRPWWQVWKR